MYKVQTIHQNKGIENTEKFSTYELARNFYLSFRVGKFRWKKLVDRFGNIVLIGD